MNGEAAGNPQLPYERRGKLIIIDPDKTKRIVVAGDIHGDLRAFKRIISLLTPGDLAVFLGDYADRGPFGLEVIEGLKSAVQRLPGCIVALKGNHEDFSQDGEPLFQPCTLREEAARKGRNWKAFFPNLKAFFDTLPLAAVIHRFALLVHGGVSEEITSPDMMENPGEAVEKDIIWSDPGSSAGQHPNPRGAGKRFGADVTARVLGLFGASYLIRSHEPQKAPEGPCFEHDGTVITISATSLYGGRAFVLLLPANKLPVSRKAFLNCVRYLY